jgi:CheY-like chemotaxis protein
MADSEDFEEQEFPLEPPKPDWPRARGKECILVAEDSEALRDLMLAMLSGLGYEVLTAGGGHEALRQIERHHGVDLVITDAIMPKGGGFQIVDEVRERWPGTPVVITSGFTEEIEAGLRERLEGRKRSSAATAEEAAAEPERAEAGTETEVEADPDPEPTESILPHVEFLPKPFRPEELARRVREILDRAKAASPPRRPR